MANLIEIPYNDGVTETNVLINGDAVFDIEISYDAVTGTLFNIGLQELGHCYNGGGNVKNISIYFAGSGHTSTDIGIHDANALKQEIRRNASKPGGIGSWKPLNYDSDPVRYSITSYKSLSKPAGDY